MEVGLTVGDPLEEEEGLWMGDALVDLNALANARRSRCWTLLSSKLNCLPRQS